MPAAAPSPAVTAAVSGAENVAISNPTFNVAARRDNVVHNHYSQPTVKRPKTLEELMDSIPNFRQIYQDMLSKATPGTGMWLVETDELRVWLDADGSIKILWGSGIRESPPKLSLLRS